MKKVSLFLNTRGRVDDLDALLKSIKDTTFDISRVEIIIKADKDDYNTIRYLESIDLFMPLDVVSVISYRVSEKPQNLHEEINISAKASAHEFLMVLNDDVIFKTYGWEQKLFNLNIPKDGVLYVASQDDSVDKEGGKDYASFPILTRGAYNALEYFMSEQFVGLGGDVHLWRVFSELDRVHHSDILLHHVHHSTVDRVINPDQTAAEMRANTKNNYVDCWKVDISEDVERVRKCLK